MGSYIGTANDYFNIQAEMKLKEEGVTKFEDLFMNDYALKKENATQNYFNNLENLSNTLSIESNAIQNKYDISSAYANYKQSQLQLMQSNLIGSGVEQKKSLLKNAYDQTFNNYQKYTQDELYLLQKDYESKVKTETDKLNTTLEKYENLREADIENLRKQFNADAKKYAQIEGIIREIIGIDDSNAKDYYETIVNSDGTKTIKLKDIGIDEFDRVINSVFTDTDAFVMKDPNDKTKEKKYYSLTDYLFDLDQDLYDFYVNNKSNINKWVAGIEANDNEYTKEERRYEMERKDFETQINELIKNTKDSGAKANMQKKLDDLAKKEFKDNAEKRNAYEALKVEFETKPLEQHRMSSEETKEFSFSKSPTDGKFFNVDGKSYEEASMYKNKNSTTTSSDTPLDVYSAVGLGTQYQSANMRKNNLSEGSVVTHNGKYYVIRKNPNKQYHGDLAYFLMELKPVKK